MELSIPRFSHSMLVVGLATAVLGCGAHSTTGSAPLEARSVSTHSLYDRLGGKPAIAAVVEQFVSNVAADQRINGRFATTDITRLKGHLVDQICSATGGPCTYHGRDMKSTHAGMRINNEDFTALVQDLTAALDKLHVPAKEQRELLALLGPMKKDIVEVP